MNLQEATTILDTVLGQQTLTNVQDIIFRQAWLGRSYREIAESTKYDVNYIKDSGYRLWKLLSDRFGQKVSKNNICSVLRKFTHVLEETGNVDSANRQRSPDAQTDAQADPQADPQTDPEQNRLEAQAGIPTPVRSLSPLANQTLAIEHLTNQQELIGRGRELQSLEKWVLTERSKVISITGIVGIGKTALVAQFCTVHQAQFDHIVWLSLRHFTGAEAVCRSVLDQISSNSCDRYDGTPIQAFLDCLQNYRCLILIDDFDASSQTNLAADHLAKSFEEYAKLIALTCQVNHRSCLILIGREDPVEISIMQGYKLDVRTLKLTGLETQHISKVIPCSLSGQALEKLTEVYDGNPLFLNLAASQINKTFSGDFSLFEESSTFICREIFDILNKQFSQLSENEQKILIYLCIHPSEISLSDFPAIAAKFLCFEYIADLDSLSRKNIITIDQSEIKVIFCFERFVLDMLSSCFFQDFLTFLTRSEVDRNSIICQYPLYTVRSSFTFNSKPKELSEYESNALACKVIDKLAHCFEYELFLIDDLTRKRRELKNRKYADRPSLTFLKNASLIIDSLHALMMQDDDPSPCIQLDNFSHSQKPELEEYRPALSRR